MQSVGIQLREARLSAGLSLDQVSARTCIPTKILQALENDDLQQISSAFFYRSFVRQFAEQVHLSPAFLSESVAVAVEKFPEPLVPGQGNTVARATLVRPMRRPRNVRWLYPAVSLAFVLVACSGFYAYWERAKQKEHPGAMLEHRAVLAAPKALVTAAPKSQSQLQPRISQLPAPLGIAQRKAAVPPEPDGLFHVQLSAVERTWLSIRSDGRQIYSGTLEVDQTKSLEGHQEGQLRTGNAGGINIVFNGKPIGLAGPHGSIRTVVFTRDNYEVLPPVRASLNSLPISMGEWVLLLPRFRLLSPAVAPL